MMHKEQTNQLDRAAFPSSQYGFYRETCLDMFPFTLSIPTVISSIVTFPSKMSSSKTGMKFLLRGKNCSDEAMNKRSISRRPDNACINLKSAVNPLIQQVKRESTNSRNFRLFKLGQLKNSLIFWSYHRPCLAPANPTPTRPSQL